MACTLTSCVQQNLPDDLNIAGPETVPITKYVIQAGDELEINFLDNVQFDQIMDVRPDGFISLPAIGEVHADGYTVPELTQILNNMYDEVINLPDINIIVRSFSSNVVFIGGDVKEPSAIYFDNKITVLQAIALAGGYNSQSAIIDKVIVIRRQPGQPPKRIIVNLSDIISGDDISQDFYLYQYDTIYIGSRI